MKVQKTYGRSKSNKGLNNNSVNAPALTLFTLRELINMLFLSVAIWCALCIYLCCACTLLFKTSFVQPKKAVWLTSTVMNPQQQLQHRHRPQNHLLQRPAPLVRNSSHHLAFSFNCIFPIHFLKLALVNHLPFLPVFIVV